MNKLKNYVIGILLLMMGFGIIDPSVALALSNKSGSDPSGKSQRYVIENAPWYDPTACPSGVANTAPSSGQAQKGKIYVIGDSITEASIVQNKLKSSLTNSDFTPIEINSKASRRLSEGSSNLDGITILQNDKDKWKDAKTIIVELGTNGGISASSIQKTIQIIKDGNASASIYWINVGANNAQRPSSSPIRTDEIANLLNTNSNLGYSIIDWKTVADANPNYITNDGLGVHPYTEEGSSAYVDTIMKSLGAGASTGTTTVIQSSCSCPTGVVNSGFNGSNNAEIAFNFFNGKQGISAAQAAGIVGNFMVESGINVDPNALNSIGAFGIAQWLSGRKDRLIEFARSQGKEPNDLGVQLEFVMVELNGSENRSLTELLKTTTPSEAAERWDEFYERSGNAAVPQRQQYAEEVFIKYGGNAVGNYSVPGTINCSNNPGSIGQAPNGFVFPLITTKKQIRDGNGVGLNWCYTDQTSCHGVYPAADIGVPEGTEVVASIGGKVLKGDPSCSKDCAVSIKGTDQNVYYYDHMKGGSIAVRDNDTVKPGQRLGVVGSAQDAENTSPHLHFSIMNSKWDYYPACSRENGCPVQVDMIDPQPWLTEAYKYLPE